MTGLGNHEAALPAIKFFKNAVPDILSGAKTLEPRAHSHSWVRRISHAERVRLTYGPRMGTPTTFAVARIVDVTIRPFETATRADVDRIGSEWVGRDVADFVTAFTDWYAPQLAKGYTVAWIEFVVEDGAV